MILVVTWKRFRIRFDRSQRSFDFEFETICCLLATLTIPVACGCVFCLGFWVER